MSHRRSQNSQNTQILNNTAVNICVRYILYREGSKIPIKHADIRDHLKSTCDIPNHQISATVAAASRILKDVYGYMILKDNSKGNHYIVTLEEPCDILPQPILEPQENIILNAGLTHIFMSGGSVIEENMWAFLTAAGLMHENNWSAVKQMFTKKFTQQCYILCTKCGEGDFTKLMFQWGSRACKEGSKMFILQKVAEALEKTPEFWTEQYKIATSEMTK